MKEGRREGLREGMEKGKQEVVENLLATGKFTVSEIADFAVVTEEFVEKVRTLLGKRSNKRHFPKQDRK